ncbi:MAG: chromosomal replication initiator protein DnaA [Candidatus Euphemobacter frigidus]|nr:chromosomal replication initiator protein DnaA [Candidatus Euphemobacter frigidus]MDP8276424.1 chromosomal replication initiator protein DnaA [Candidatus Euphemobacter frigidus]
MDHLTTDLLSQLKDRLGEQNYQTWISTIRSIAWEEEKLIIEVPNLFFRDWLQEHYLEIMEDTASRIVGRTLQIVFTISRYPHSLIPEPLEEMPSQKRPSYRISNLNPKYTFERFVVGASNQFANAATMAVAHAPGKAYNPLFLYGGVGLGKTHLMQAAANTILGHDKKFSVLYISSESFTNDFINAIGNRTTDKFRKKYREVDVLLIDDIHFLGGQVKTQEQFFHTFNHLFDLHKQIILCSDRPPQDIPDIAERLISRFEWGLVVDIQPPDRETRIAILRKEAEYSGLSIPDDIIFYIADRIKSNIRKLEGALIQVASYSSLTNTELTMKTAELVLAGIVEDEMERVITIDQIQRKLSDYYDIRMADMKSSRRPNAIAYPRQLAMYLARIMTGRSLSEIGDAFGGRDHTTVLHACQKIGNQLNNDKHLSNTLSYLEKEIRHATV